MANQSKVHPWRKGLNSYITGNRDVTIAVTYIVEMKVKRKKSRRTKPVFEELIPRMGEEAIEGYLFCDFDDLILKETIASAKSYVNDMISAGRALGVRLGALPCLGVSGITEIQVVAKLKKAFGFRGYVYVIDVSDDDDRQELMDCIEEEGLCLKQPAPTPTPSVQIHEIGAVDWMRLPDDLTAGFLSRVGAFELLEDAQFVCKKWYKICKEPVIWKSIDMSNCGNILEMPFDVLQMAKEAINRSSGQVYDISLDYFGTDDLLTYISDRASQLRRLRLGCCIAISDAVLVEFARKLPCLEELRVGKLVKTTPPLLWEHCPKLKVLEFTYASDSDEEEDLIFDEDFVFED